MRKRQLFKPFSNFNGSYLRNHRFISVTLVAFLMGYGTHAIIRNPKYFNPLQTQEQKHKSCQVCFPSIHNCLSMVVEAVNKAEKSIQLQTYSFTSKDISKALIQARRRGVNVIILTSKNPQTYPHTKLQDLNKENIEIFFDTDLPISHSKVLIIDNVLVMTGSYHFSNEEEQKNAENFISVADKEIAEQYNKEFNRRLSKSSRNRLRLDI